jgi:hypothetical protein
VLGFWTTYLLTLIENPTVLDVRSRAMYHYDQLNESEKALFFRLCDYEMLFHENMLFQFKNARDGWVIGFQDWINRPVPKKYWENEGHEFTMELQQFVKTYLKHQ